VGKTPFLTILLAVDGGESDRATAETAMELAELCGSRMVILNVVDRSLVNRLKRFTDESPTEIEMELEEKGWRALYHAEERSKDKGIRTLITQRHGVPENEMLAEAERVKASLIVVSSPHAVPGQVRRLGPGSLDRLMESAKCPVLVVR